MSISFTIVQLAILCQVQEETVERLLNKFPTASFAWLKIHAKDYQDQWGLEALEALQKAQAEAEAIAKAEAAEAKAIAKAEAKVARKLKAIPQWLKGESPTLESGVPKNLEELPSKVRAQRWIERCSSKVSYTKVYGTKVKAIFVNDWSITDGPAEAHEGNFNIKVELPKSFNLTLSASSLSAEKREQLGFPTNKEKAKMKASLLNGKVRKALAAWQTEVENSLDSLPYGQEFSYGETILEDFWGVSFKNNNLNQILRLDKVEVVELPFSNTAIGLRVETALISEDIWKKCRGYGKKFTIMSSEIMQSRFYDENGDIFLDWQLAIGPNAMKGRTALIEAFAIAVKETNPSAEVVIRPDKGGITVDGKFHSLSETGSIVDQWVNMKTRHMTKVFVMTRCEWEWVQEAHKAEYEAKYGEGSFHIGAENYPVIGVKDIDETSVEITSKVEVLEATIPFICEVSLPEESSGTASVTPQMIQALALSHQGMAEAILQGAKSKAQRAAAANLIAMWQGKIASGAPQFMMKDLPCPKMDEKATHQQVLAAFGKMYPKGLYLRTQGVSGGEMGQYICFKSITVKSSMLGGYNDGIAGTLADFFRGLALGNIGASQLHTEWTLIVKGLMGWLNVQMESPKLFKALTAPSSQCAFGGKIRTAAADFLHHEGDLQEGVMPKLGINPNDDLLKVIVKDPETGKIPDEFLDEDGNLDITCLEGQVVVLYRTPMVMPTFCELVLSEKVGIGHMMVLPSVWCTANEGDSDGDGCLIIPGFHYLPEMTRKEKEALCKKANLSLMAMGGFFACYGHLRSKGEMPNQEIYSWKASTFAKCLVVKADSEAEKTMVKKQVLPLFRLGKAQKWVETTHKVRDHYSYCVGRAYEMAVYAMHDALESKFGDKSEKEQKVAMVTCSVLWRLVYEGLGLSGYSPDAARFFELLRISEWGTHFGERLDGSAYLLKKDQGGQPIGNALLEILGLPMNGLNIEVVKKLFFYASVMQRKSDMRKAYHDEKVQTRLSDTELLNAAIVYGAVRRTAAGCDPAHLERLEQLGMGADPNFYNTMSALEEGHDIAKKNPEAFGSWELGRKMLIQSMGCILSVQEGRVGRKLAELVY
jgi:hypothetical protein